MSKRLAYIFPGQGSQYPGMGSELAEKYPASRKVFEEADDALGFSISQLCFSGTAEELQLTENTQPAILTTSIATLRAMEAEGMSAPEFVAGHSLGEYSALVAARALSLADAVKTVRLRGRFMQEATPVGSGAMAAVMGADVNAVQEICSEAQEGDVCSPANINSPNQIVIAGDAAAVDRAIALFKERLGKRAIKLSVSAPFHCALMKPAQERLAVELEKIEFHDLRLPLITNVDAAAISSGQEARNALVRQVSSPVRWLESMQLLIQEGVQTFVEVGPGKVLCGLLRAIERNANCLNVGDAESLEKAVTSDK
ncbi:MAG: [acyl-carrier-protein] S-malonyltransferase [Acidobacteriota bacterium]|jgi:[acyl-carrier-protein] S-malonyltransferase|nr:[acyl-carrier-protein] S-malonyltransferase [Acidobacteriota bacterium]